MTKENTHKVAIIICFLLSIASLVVSLLKTGKQGPKGDKGDKGDTGVGSQGPRGLVGPQGPAGMMNVVCSGTSTEVCTGQIPTSLDVAGQITASKVTSTGDITTSGNITTNTLTASGDITQTPSGIATFGKQVIIEGENGLVLEKGSIAVQSEGTLPAYITVGQNVPNVSTPIPTGIYTSGDITTSGNIKTTSGDLNVGTNTWSPSGDINTSGNVIVGSPSNSWSPSGDITQAPSGVATFGKQVKIKGTNGLVIPNGSVGIGGGDGSKIYLSAPDGVIRGEKLQLNTKAATADNRAKDTDAAIWFPNINDGGKQIISTKFAGMNANLTRG